MVMVNSARVAAGVSRLITNLYVFLMYTGMGVYGLVLFQKLKPTNFEDVAGSSGMCKSGTTLKLLLSVACLQLVGAAFFLLGVGGQCVSVFRACIGENDKAGSRVEGFKSCITVLIGLALFGISVAMSVFVWRDNCVNLNNDADHGYYWQFLHVYLIIHWTLPIVVAILAFYLSCCVGLCAGGAVEASKDYVAITPDD